jgi:hypothetical protein
MWELFKFINKVPGIRMFGFLLMLCCCFGLKYYIDIHQYGSVAYFVMFIIILCVDEICRKMEKSK